MTTFQTTATIRIRVPDQEFSAILLVVSADTTLLQVLNEVKDQLCQRTYRPACLRVYRKDTLESTPFLFMRHCTVRQALEHGAEEFEMFFTDLCN